ncbi:hypothetical protein PIROE2DRAFT_16119 [Piromyces sp. E2]|nr:hypothetical protein PIROE2DRAFT_16119 [Piromyces sp. E2]|eukprot:OUM58569.1 hypothetical protein PIROE2DRAFT_16119 [Piromyces sp. E2]
MILFNLKGHFQSRHEKLKVKIFLIKETYSNSKGFRFDIIYNTFWKEKLLMKPKDLEIHAKLINVDVYYTDENGQPSYEND